MDVTSLYTNIPQEEGLTSLTTVCNAYETFYKNSPSITTRFIGEMLQLTQLKENSFQFNGKHYLQTHGTTMGTNMAVAFANIFMSAIEPEIIRLSPNKPLVWKRYIDDIFSLCNIDKKDIGSFIELANNHHQTTIYGRNFRHGNNFSVWIHVHKGYRFALMSRVERKYCLISTSY